MAILRSGKTGYDCGPTCFANTLNILGYDIKVNKANKLCSLTKDGTDSYDLIKAFNRYGFRSRWRTHSNDENAWNWLIKNTNRGIPAIIAAEDNSHWTLVLLAGKRKAQILDPREDYPSLISRKELLMGWGYISDNLEDPKFYCLELTPYKKKAIKAVTVREKLIATMGV